MERRENGMPSVPRRDGCSGGEMPRENMNGCGGGVRCIDENTHLASVYAPMQKWRMLYPIDKALSHGTLFEELYKPLEVSRNG
jgi:hypothetical protein